MASSLLMVFAMALFSIVHSILARLPIKAWVGRRMGKRAYEGLYRLGYNALAGITFLPVLYILFFMPGGRVWSFDGLAALPFRLLQLTGIIGLTISLLQIDLGRFIGTRQMRAYLNGDPLPLPPEPLKTNGVYGLVRHPLYLFSLLVLWFTPNMTSTALVFVITATIYFVLGSILEERTMVKLFGQTYQQYQQRVPWLVPFVRLPHRI